MEGVYINPLFYKMIIILHQEAKEGGYFRGFILYPISFCIGKICIETRLGWIPIFSCR